MDWSGVDATRELVGTLGLPLAVAETLYGGSATVHKYWEPALNRYVVGKRVVVFDRPLAEALREPRLQNQLQHDHLVPVITVSDVLDTSVFSPERRADEVEIITPYYPDGSVFDALRRGVAFDVVEALDIVRAAALGLAELHGEGFVHRDFKSPNVFLTADTNVARVGDLGEAHPLDERWLAPGLDSPTPWIAPEQVAHDLSTIASDLFGLGVVLVELLVGGLDLSEYQREVAHARMLAGQTPLPQRMMNPPPWAPPPIRTLVRQLTHPSPVSRKPSTATQVADRLSECSAIGWRRVRDDPPRWEGMSRRRARQYAVDARYLPRNREWEVSILRRGDARWRAVGRQRHQSLETAVLQDAFDAALDADD